MMTTTAPDAGTVFLTALTDVLAPAGWTRADTTPYGQPVTTYTHPDSPAILTVTGYQHGTLSAQLGTDDTAADAWRVASDNPTVTTLAAAANATVPEATATAQPLTGQLADAGWPVRLEREAGRLVEELWSSPEGTEVSFFPGDRFERPGWLIIRSRTSNGVMSRAQYCPSADTPDAVLSALVFDR